MLVGSISAREAARVIAKTRAQLPLGRLATDLYVTIPRVPLSRSVPVESVLDVRGTIAGVRVAKHLGDGGPSSFEVRVPHAKPRAKLRLTVSAVPPSKLMATGTRVNPDDLLEHVSRVRLMIARALQYQTFLVNPNSNGRSSAVYVYETQAKAAVAPRPTSSPEDEGSNPLRLALVTVLALGALGALVVLWAHS